MKFMDMVCARVLGAAQARFHQGESGLHEHDQEPRDQGPHEVDRDAVMPDRISELHRQGLDFQLSDVVGICLLIVVIGLNLRRVLQVVGAQFRRRRRDETARGGLGIGSHSGGRPGGVRLLFCRGGCRRRCIGACDGIRLIRA